MTIDFISQITASDLIGWFLAFLGGFIAYRIVDNMQTSLERHSVISDIETKINELFSSNIAKSSNSKESPVHHVTVRTILHDFTPWNDYSKKTDVIVDDSQRYINIRNDDKYTEYVSTQALHEFLILFRRLEKLHKSKIIKNIDLADLWREIMPCGVSNRLGFLKSYYSDRDIESILYVFMHTVIACESFKMDNAIKYIKANYLKEDKDLRSHFVNNRRLRRIDKFSLRRFEKIIDSIQDDE